MFVILGGKNVCAFGFQVEFFLIYPVDPPPSYDCGDKITYDKKLIYDDGDGGYIKTILFIKVAMEVEGDIDFSLIYVYD